LAIAAGALVAVALAIALPLSLHHKSKHSQSNSSSNPGSNGTGNGNPNNPKNPSNAITGGDGSTITTGDGTSFVYNNSFGGSCEFLFPTQRLLRMWAPDGRHMMFRLSWDLSTLRVPAFGMPPDFERPLWALDGVPGEVQKEHRAPSPLTS
jgi:hypothetical protein